MLEIGNKILVAHRRLFDKDEPRYFVGEVLAYADGIAKARGYTFVRDVMTGNFLRKNDVRIKVVSLVSGTFILYLLPDEAVVDSIAFETQQTELYLTDGKTLKMNLTEQPHRGQI